MEEQDELIISLNSKENFDLDINDAYPEGDENDYFKYLRPCYIIEEETVDKQDWIVGRSLAMYG